MASLNDDFDRILRRLSKGKLWRLDTPPSDTDEFSRLKAFCDRSINVISNLRKSPHLRPSMPDVHLDIIDNMSLNAVAFVEGGQGYVGITRGAVLLVYDLFCRILSHPDMFANIGDPKNESVRLFHSEGLHDDYSELTCRRPPADRRIGAVVPEDPGRRAFAEWLAVTALEFLLLHEMAHIRNGHCEYWNSQVGIPFLMEHNSGLGLPGDKILTRQTFEMDADAFATCIMINIIIMHFSNIGPREIIAAIQAASRPWIWTPRNIFDAIVNWQFATAKLFWSLGLHYDELALETFEHPFPIHRMHLVAATADETLRVKAGDELRQYFLDNQSNHIDLLINASAAISNGAISPDLRKFLIAFRPGGALNQQTNRMLAHWKILRPELLRYSHVPNLAP